jgi:ABC-2 type transport system permease protein
MRELAVIFKREFRSYFLSPIAYVVGAIFLVVGAGLFFRTVFLEGTLLEARMNSYFMFLPMAFLLLAPALTMRLWSEERKLGTLELLLTFPVKTWQLILGKFLAALAFMVILLVLTLPYPLTLNHYAELDWGPVMGGYIGAVLMAGAYLSVGLFCSSVSRDQIIALLLSVTVLFVLYAMGQPDWLYFAPNWLTRPMVTLSLSNAFTSISKGVLDSRDILYYLGITSLFLYLNSVVLEAKKWQG